MYGEIYILPARLPSPEEAKLDEMRENLARLVKKVGSMPRGTTVAARPFEGPPTAEETIARIREIMMKKRGKGQ
ncbi:hypothetical protein COX86_00840 [Candidatus Micrarchaeota archaeon CG_4_10_14_0_2_um_filter_60_11]|nr:MAG: hypothetical protein AUJ16_00555 [Candidatus Micrarchaeota archaeon CG1_02_60_51]PIN95975.1 MAG: hypothetical protein COU39_03135 [Candidatus Micrarchaeota archaeon CG10_big_fil_rev_8_21_14_0_10_60_32]PIO02171.1 MAG: hypothetical protein COT58_01420 [Candidatus Micrarchaeota archaeon CG09_land_8_20_14_0_10_60_16]PIY91451.1 MAG: hypothetical protein COY71_03060 [Candidatus Micrarchaeota archaeon CG_4_10_14_0_8_um_filter_60_7]PIZ91220.1 MAG: hypothetical protein COX86_00840 [Candidatus Mi